MFIDRLDRQQRIAGWKQEVLERSSVVVIGDDPLLTSLFILSASALGLNRLTAMAPGLNSRITDIARKINEKMELAFLEGYFVHPAMNCLLRGCKAIVDLTGYGIANKLSFHRSFLGDVPTFRGFITEGDIDELKVFTYMKGREWDELTRVMSPSQFPSPKSHDPVLSIILSGIVLEEVCRFLMGFGTSDEVISYGREKPGAEDFNLSICVVGAGALGNFVGLGLALSGFKNVTFMDPDVIEISNLNRQVFFYDSVGKRKAQVLAERLSEIFEINARYDISYFDMQTDISSFDIVFDCVDNFETRLVISRKCKEERKLLISGGSSASAGQVVVYDPRTSRHTPAEILGLDRIVDERKLNHYRRRRESCIYRPEPSVVMTNQVIAGFMVDLLRLVLGGYEVDNIFYDSNSPKKI